MKKAMAEWLVANGFKEIDKGVRCRLLECLQYSDEIKKWRELLTESERFRLHAPWTRSCANGRLRPRSPHPTATSKSCCPTPSSRTRTLQALSKRTITLSTGSRPYTTATGGSPPTPLQIRRDGCRAVAREGGTHRKGNPQEAQGTKGQRMITRMLHFTGADYRVRMASELICPHVFDRCSPPRSAANQMPSA